MSDKVELAKKLKALAERSNFPEEANAAAARLEVIMKKYNITESDINDDTLKEHEFCFSQNKIFTQRLLNQIVYMICGDIDSEKGVYQYVHKSKNRCCIKCTPAEFLQITAMYEFFVHHLTEDLDLFYKAFIQINNIFPAIHLKSKENEDDKLFLSEEELKIIKIASGLDKHEYRQQIEH